MPSYSVTLLPSKHRFTATSKQNLLAAGLSSGLNLSYGCEHGNCGKCQARLVEGKIQTIRHSDFMLSPEQIANGYFLSCCSAAQSDCRIEAAELDSTDEIPQQQIYVRVYRMQRLAHDVLSVVLRTPRSQPLNFFAGQSVCVTLTNGLKRNKSIASCPCDALKPEFHVKYQQGDAFSEYVFNQLKKNDMLDIQGPEGEFVLDDDSLRPLVFIAYDTGFSSIKSLIEHAIALQKEQPMRLYWICSPGNSPYMKNYCRSIEDALDNFSYRTLSLRENTAEAFSRVLQLILAEEKLVTFADIFITLPETYRCVPKSLFDEAGISDRYWRADMLQRL